MPTARISIAGTETICLDDSARTELVLALSKAKPSIEHDVDLEGAIVVLTPPLDDPIEVSEPLARAVIYALDLDSRLAAILPKLHELKVQLALWLDRQSSVNSESPPP